MAYSIPGLHGTTSFEFPHAHYYDGDLTEILRMYKIVVEDYNTLVNEIVEAHRLYIEAQEFVERQERIFLDNQAKIMQHFDEVIAKAEELNQQLIDWFKRTSAEQTEAMERLEILFRELNTTQLESMKNFFDTAIADFIREREAFQQRLEETMRQYQEELDASLDTIIEVIEGNNDSFKVWIGTKFDFLANVIQVLNDNITGYTLETQDLFNRLRTEYSNKLELTKQAIIRENNIRFDIERQETDEDFQELRDYVDRLIAEINAEIEKCKKIANHELVEHIHVVSPVTRKIRKLQWALNEMYVFYRAWALRAEEYDALELTAQEYDDWQGNVGLYPKGKGIKAIDYDALGKWILLEKPDILEQVRDDIEQITYEELEKNADRIVEEMTARLEEGWGQKVVSLEEQCRILENLIHGNNEYTARVEEALNIHIELAMIAENAIRRRLGILEATSSVHAGRLDMIDITTSSISNRVLMLESTTSYLNGQMDMIEEYLHTTSSTVNGRLDTLEANSQMLVDAILNMQQIVLNALKGGE